MRPIERQFARFPRSTSLPRSVLMLICAASSCRGMPDPLAIDGTYLTPRQVAAALPRVPTSSFDCLRIESRGEETVWFELVLVEDNEMSCTVRGEARWTGDELEFRAPDGAADGEPPCRLRLEITSASITIDDSDVGPRCHSYYCGASAALLARFSRNERLEQGGPCPEAPSGFLESIEESERFIEQRLRDLEMVPDGDTGW